MPSGHPIILLKSNKFNMAAVVVKRSIACLSRMPRALGLLIFLIAYITVFIVIHVHHSIEARIFSPIVCTLIGYLRSHDIQQ